MLPDPLRYSYMTEATISTDAYLRADVLSVPDNDPDFHPGHSGATVDVWKFWTRTTRHIAHRMTKSAYTGLIPISYQECITAVQEVDISPESPAFEPVGNINKGVEIMINGQEHKKSPNRYATKRFIGNNRTLLGELIAWVITDSVSPLACEYPVPLCQVVLDQTTTLDGFYDHMEQISHATYFYNIGMTR